MHFIVDTDQRHFSGCQDGNSNLKHGVNQRLKQMFVKSRWKVDQVRQICVQSEGEPAGPVAPPGNIYFQSSRKYGPNILQSTKDAV